MEQRLNMSIITLRPSVIPLRQKVNPLWLLIIFQLPI